MKTIYYCHSAYEVVSSLETEKHILLIVKRPKGKKQWLAYQYPNGQIVLSGVMPTSTTKENAFTK